MTFCRSIYVKKGMKLLAFIFEQPSYLLDNIYPGFGSKLYIYRGTVLDFFSQDHAYKNKHKSASVGSDLEMDTRLIKCLVL